jgi:protein Mpv17
LFRCFHAPIIEICWRFFDAKIGASSRPFRETHRSPRSSLAGLAGTFVGVAGRILGDQLLLAPPSIMCFYVSQGLMEGNDLEASVARAKESFWPSYSVCLPFWSAVHVVTFSVVPVPLRMAWASFCSVGWNAFISHANHAAGERQRQRRENPADHAHPGVVKNI